MEYKLATPTNLKLVDLVDASIFVSFFNLIF